MSKSSAHQRRHNVTLDAASGRARGVITRGTTAPNRLRRSDRWSIHHQPIIDALHATKGYPTTSTEGTIAPALAVDVGYGASHTTTCEWARWLRRLRPDISVVGLEIHPDRVLPPRDGVRFQLGGFELAGLRPNLVRAFNVLRQYDVAEVEAAWDTMAGGLADGGCIIEGTCDELGRRASWIVLNADGPQTLTLAWDPFDCQRPGDIAERLPKYLIHRNHPGDTVYELLRTIDAAWDRCAPLSVYGPRHRWRATLELLIDEGITRFGPAMNQRRPVRDCVITVDWALIEPTH